MFNATYDSMFEAYAELVAGVLKHGFDASPRGKRCREVRPAAFTITDPRLCLYPGKSRQLNLRFLAIETLSYIAGWGDEKHAMLMANANPSVAQFVGERGVFDGAYGPRLIESMGDICDRLAADPWSRQCFASIWQPGLPPASVRDIPCTTGLSFYAEPMRAGPRGGAIEVAHLSMTAVMRSNDLNWGTPYDVAAFAAIQMAAAEVVDMPNGAYNHYASSLHVYHERQEDGGAEGPPAIPASRNELYAHAVRLPTCGHGFRSWGALAGACDGLLLDCVDTLQCGGSLRGLPKYDNQWLEEWATLIRESKRLYDA